MNHRTPPPEYAQTIAQIEALPCRCCLQTSLQAFVQEALRPGGREIIYVHCLNRSCALYYVTRAFKDWVKFDLSAWRTVEHPDWAAAVARLAPAVVVDEERNLRALVETFIVEREAPIADLVMRDFREQYRGTLPHQRRSFCHEWLRLYTGAAS